MKTDAQKGRRTRPKERFSLGTIGSIPWKPGCEPAFAASSRNFWKRNSTLRWGRTVMNGLGLARSGAGGRSVLGAAGRLSARPSRARIDGNLRAGDGACARARLEAPDGKTAEWKNATIPAYQRRTKQADALIAGAYLSGTNTRRVRQALAALFRRCRRQGYGQPGLARGTRRLGRLERPIARRRADHPPHPRWHGRARPARQEIDLDFLACRPRRETGRPKGSPGGQGHGRRKRSRLAGASRRSRQARLENAELIIVDGAPGLEKALAALWSNVAVQRCTVHKHRNLLAHAPDRLHDELSADYKDIIYADTKPRDRGETEGLRS